MLRDTIWNIIDFSGVSSLTDLIDAVLSILIAKFANPAMVLLSCIKVSSCDNTLSWSICSVNCAWASELLNNLLNLMLLYYKS